MFDDFRQLPNEIKATMPGVREAGASAGAAEGAGTREGVYGTVPGPTHPP